MEERNKVAISGATGKMMMAAAVLAGLTLSPASAQSAKKVPYWVSITEAEARMRVGPSFDYPANWVYRRKGLPVKVVQVLNNWRKIEDSTGTQGWMHVRLLGDAATAIVIGQIAEMREKPDDKADVRYRAEAGVVGRVSDCSNGWCTFDVQGQKGFVRAASLWGATE